MEGRRIGELNGRWSVLFRGLMIIIGFFMPALITLQAWEVKTLHSLHIQIINVDSRLREFTERSRNDNLMMKIEIMEDVSNRINRLDENHPPKDLLDQITEINKRISVLERAPRL